MEHEPYKQATCSHQYKARDYFKLLVGKVLRYQLENFENHFKQQNKVESVLKLQLFPCIDIK